MKEITDIMLDEKEEFLSKWNISKFSHHAMNTIFQIFIADEDFDYANQAAHEAFKEIDLLEDLLSRYRANSDISKINNLEPGKIAVVSEDALNCLIKSVEIFDLTDGHFDISLGDVIKSFKEDQSGKIIRTDSNMKGLLIDPVNHSIILNKSINIDLGGIGKGYAAEKICELFEEWEIENYLISCGNSTIKVRNSNNIAWPISFTNPNNNSLLGERKILAGSISSSGLKKGKHIINPMTNLPVDNNRLTCWIHSEDAILSDSLSTAFMIMDLKEIEDICNKNDSISCGILIEKEDIELVRFGSFFDILSD